MSVASGNRTSLIFKQESVYATHPGGTGTVLGFNSESLEKRINTFISDEIRADRRVPNVRGGNVMAGGDITLDLGFERLGMLLRHLLMPDSYTPIAFNDPGAIQTATAYVVGDYVEDATTNRIWVCTVSGTTAGSISLPSSPSQGDFSTQGTAVFQYLSDTDADPVYRHVFIGGNTFPVGGLTFEKEVTPTGGTSSFFQFLGGRVNTMAITVPQEGISTATLGLLFKDLDDVPSASGFSATGTPADDPPVGYEFSIHVRPFGSGAYTQNLVSRDFSMNIANNLDDTIFVFGNRFRKDIVEGRREVTGTLTAYFEDLTEFNRFQNESKVDVLFQWISVGKAIRIHLPEVKFTGGTPTPQVGGPGVITSNYDFQAFNSAGPFDIRLELVNLTQTYLT